MIPTGYDVQQEIYRGRRRVVWRGTRASDGLRVIIKTSADEYPVPAQVAALRREYAILTSLEFGGVARPVELLTHRDRVSLILEDAGDATLKSLIAQGPLPIALVLAVGTRLATVLGELHRRGIIHKDVNPNNVLVDSASGRVTLTDFGIASRLSSEQQAPSHPHLLEGTIAYMSPEQTGRMNRDVDYRSDFYSLGITLYEALTGRLPFESSDPLELIHAHIARIPEPPGARRSDVPEPVSQLVMRLLAKAPEDRYQGAHGLRADLERFAAEWHATGTISGDALGADDLPDRFAVPQRLYGRALEVHELREAFERVGAGSTELILVSGYSGIGKTSLIHELYKSLARRKGNLIAGKFDQLARDVPYRGVTQALRSLVRQVLTGSEQRLAEWAERLAGALGPSAQVIIDVVPELERILGPQPPPATLGAAEAQNRFNLLFQKFVGAFARPDEPLVIFLDDLQWADAATLALLPVLLTDPTITGLLLIGAYRDNEVSATHPLRMTVADVASRKVPVRELTLAPLAAGSLQDLVADAFGADAEHAAAVAELVLTKTGGNPFFVRQLLLSLHQERLITFDEATRSWRADLARMERVQVADNVVSLMTAKIERLAPRAQQALRLAACVGDRFDLQTLATISEVDPKVAATDLWVSVEEGLVLPLDKSYGFAPDLSSGITPVEIGYRFLHDRVQQAAYALIPEDSRSQVHLTIGRLLLGRESPYSLSEQLFDVVNHLNYGRALVTSAEERLRLAELNLAAGRKAKVSAAYPSALTYFTVGTELLSDSAWTKHYALAFALHLERAEAEYLCGRLQDAEAGFLALLEHCRSPHDRADVYALLMVEYETMSRYGDAIAAGLDGLARLNVAIPANAADWEGAVTTDLEAIRRAIGGRPIASLVDLPQVEEPRIRQAMRLLQATWAPAYISGQTRLGDLVAARLVRLSLEHGISEPSAFGFLHHAITVGSGLGQYQRGGELGQLALAINERFADLRLRAIVHHRFAALVNPWRQPFASCIRHAREAVGAAFESGNLQVAGYAQFQQAWYGMMIEPDLPTFQERHGPTVELLTRLQLHPYADMQRIMLQWAEALQGHTAAPTELSGPGFEEGAYRNTVGRSGIFRALLATVKLELLHTFGRTQEAREHARNEAAAAAVFVGSIWPAMFAFRHALVLCAWLPDAPAEEKPEAEATLDVLQAQLGRWAESAPENFGHLHLLVSAEIARFHQRTGDAMACYEAALEAVATQESPRHRALINELYGRFWLLDRKQPKVGAAFLAEARYGYAQWGAAAKVADMDRQYADFLRPDSQETRVSDVPSAVLLTSKSFDSALDAAGVMKAAQAIAREVDLELLLDRLMRVALETAGAERGVLVLEREGQPMVRVIASPAGVMVGPEPGAPLSQSTDLPVSLIQYVRRTLESVVVADAPGDERCANDPYIVRERPRSVLCTPVVNQGTLVGILYMENRLTPDAFATARVRVMQMLSSQAAIAIENARLFERTRTEVAERTRAETKLRTVVEGTAMVTAEEFFRSLVRHVAQGLNARYAFVAECVDVERTRVRTLAFWDGTGFADNIEFPLEGTPCQQVISGELCFHPSQVQALFPRDTDLRTLGAESYLGVPLRNAVGDILGHLAVLDTAPMAPAEDDFAILRIFAARAGAELERERAVDALREALDEVQRLKDRLESENVYLQEQIETEHGFEEIIGRSSVLRLVLGQVEQVAPTDATVLIAGETGTGKELLARAIHRLSPRRDRALITVNCGAVAPGLVESELFGHEKGAFTGALNRRVGRFEVADGGTLFLDEIGDLPLDLQVKLLRVLQEGEFERVGGSRPIKVDARVIAATHRDLEALVREGRFRADLFYRLNVFPIRSPALRERVEDIPELVRHFVLKYSAKLGKRIESVPKDALDGMAAYRWPGNVRELANIIERSVILSRGPTLELDGLLPMAETTSARGLSRAPTLEELERAHILDVLEQTGWRVSGPKGAAVLLGLKATTLEARMRKLGVTRPG